jgi:hypothetical protein
MIAYFSSKFKKQIQTALTAALLVFCLLGTHWMGLTHSITHAGIQGQSIDVSNSSTLEKSFGHSSDICHLFDALSLAGFIPGDQSTAAAILPSAIEQSNTKNLFLRNSISSIYQSRAPPTFIL